MCVLVCVCVRVFEDRGRVSGRSWTARLAISNSLTVHVRGWQDWKTVVKVKKLLAIP